MIMKKLFTFLAIAVLAAACEGPMGPMGPQGPAGYNGHDGKDGTVSKLVIDNIEIAPKDWEEYTVDGYFDHYFCDVKLPGFTSSIFNTGFYYIYWKYYEDGGNGTNILIQEGEGATMYYEGSDNGEVFYYQETISCDYSAGWVRINFRSSDFYAGSKPDKPYLFRFVAFY